MEWLSIILENMPPLRKPLRPNLAAFLGVMTGGIGLGIYLHSFVDVLAAIVLTTACAKVLGLESLLALWCCSGMYGYLRVAGSNRRLASMVAAAQITTTAVTASPAAPPTAGALPSTPATGTPATAVSATQPWFAAQQPAPATGSAWFAAGQQRRSTSPPASEAPSGQPEAAWYRQLDGGQDGVS